MPWFLRTVAPQLYSDSCIYWFYVAKVIVGAWLVWEMRPFVPELRWAVSWEAVVVGIAILLIWVCLDPFYPQLKTNEPLWNPMAHFGDGSAAAWLVIAVRIFGMTFVVPPLEEAFYRSFLYRYFARADFLEMRLGTFHPTAFAVTSVVFGISHAQWLAGVLCGVAYQGLVIRKGRLGDAMTAHAITNFLLGVYVVWRGDWKFF